jgi:hypothetical protein
MSRNACRLVGVLALMVGMAITASCGSRADAHADRPPPCLPALVARSQSYTLDPGFAMALATAMTYDHPEVGPLVNALADYQAAHPDTGLFEPDAADADVASLASILLVANLASGPDQPSEDELSLMHRYEDAARAHGMTGVYRVLQYEAREPHRIDPPPIPRLVMDQVTAVREAGVVGASETFGDPPTACEASDAPG